MRKIILLIAAFVIVFLGSTSIALAAWPSSSQGDQYAGVNNALVGASASAGISEETFISIYNDAITGNLSGFTSSQLGAACQTLSSLSSYKSVLSDYDTVYNNLGCSTRTATADSTRSSLPSTGIAALILLGLGVGITGGLIVLRRMSTTSG
jgi:hypothetical protein